VLLGFPDVEVTTDHEVSWWSNKIGGLPNWMDSVPVDEYPCCGACGVKLAHLIQVYCPLDSSPYHRTLNLFGCMEKGCWNKPDSIVVLRSQEMEAKPVRKEKPKVMNAADWGCETSWCDDGDDWGVTSDEHVYDSMQAVDVNVAITNDSNTQEVDGLPRGLDELNITDKIHINMEGVVELTEYHLYVQEETLQKLVGSNDYEMKLYEEYIKREGAVEMNVEEEEESCGKKKKGRSRGDGTEKYEKTKSKLGDENFHHFKKTIAPYPGQLMRYDWCGKHLLLSSRSPIKFSTTHPPTNKPSMTSPPNCPICQSKRVFELQLMPSLLNYLHHRDNPGITRIEFGCVYVFSCSKACWGEGSGPRREFVALQPDPDVDVVK